MADIMATVLKQGEFQALSQQDFQALGIDHIAYVKRVAEPRAASTSAEDAEGKDAGSAAFSIHAADGTPLSTAPNRETAFAAIRQHDLEPLSVH